MPHYELCCSLVQPALLGSSPSSLPGLPAPKMARRIADIENELFDYLRTKQYFIFLQTFNLYLGLTPPTNSSLRLKVLALLLYLAKGNMEDYYILIQSIRMDELADEGMQFILQVEECMAKRDMETLRNISGRYNDEIGYIMNMLVERLSKEEEQTATPTLESNEPDKAAAGSSDNLQNIKDCIFVCKNFPPNDN